MDDNNSAHKILFYARPFLFPPKLKFYLLSVYLIIYFCVFFFVNADGFTSFRNVFPEWCEEVNVDGHSHHRGGGGGGIDAGPSEQLMGLRFVGEETN